jgi:hypothetical protein
MRVLGLVLAGALVLTASIGVQAGSPGSKMGRGDAGAAPGIAQVWGGSGPNWHPAPTEWRKEVPPPDPSHPREGSYACFTSERPSQTRYSDPLR